MTHWRNDAVRRRRRQSLHRRGAMGVLIAVCLPLFLVIAAFAVNVAYMHLSRAELRVAADAAARAGGRTLSISQDIDQARAAAVDAAARNLVAGEALQLVAADIEFGLNNRAGPGAPWVFTPNGGSGIVNAVRVTGRKTDGSPSSPVPLFFVGVLNNPHFEPIRTSVSMQVDRDVVLIVDRSGSMNGNIVGVGKKWELLKDAVSLFLTKLEGTIPEELVSLVWYDHQVGRSVELTSNYQLIRDAMDALQPRGRTAIGDGLTEGIGALENLVTARPYAQKTVVLMTDGRHNTGPSPDVIATNAVDEGKNLYINTVTFGTRANQTLMQDVAEIGSGRHWHAEAATDLLDAYAEIANDIPTVLTH